MIRIITMTVFYSRQTGRPVKEFRYEGGHCSAGISREVLPRIFKSLLNS